MIIGLPLNEATTGKDTVISKLLSDARAFFIYDTDTKSGRTIAIEDLLENHKTESLLEALITEKANTLICQEIFVLGYKATKELGIEVFKAESPYIEKAISMFKNGVLTPFSFDSAKNNGCSTDCSSCGDSQRKTA